VAQFSIHKNANPNSKSRVPFLLDVQHPLVAHLEFRLGVPLIPLGNFDSPDIKKLVPTVTINGKAYSVVVPLLAATPKGHFGASVADLRERRHEIIAAIDMLVSGI
jgi:toxin CcdB